MDKRNSQQICFLQKISVWDKTCTPFICIFLFYALCCTTNSFAGEQNGYDLMVEACKKSASEKKADGENKYGDKGTDLTLFLGNK